MEKKLRLGESILTIQSKSQLRAKPVYSSLQITHNYTPREETMLTLVDAELPTNVVHENEIPDSHSPVIYGSKRHLMSVQ